MLAAPRGRRAADRRSLQAFVWKELGDQPGPPPDGLAGRLGELLVGTVQRRPGMPTSRRRASTTASSSSRSSPTSTRCRTTIRSPDRERRSLLPGGGSAAATPPARLCTATARRPARWRGPLRRGGGTSSWDARSRPSARPQPAVDGRFGPRAGRDIRARACHSVLSLACHSACHSAATPPATVRVTRLVTAPVIAASRRLALNPPLPYGKPRRPASGFLLPSATSASPPRRGTLFVLGLAVWCLGSGPGAIAGLVLLLAGTTCRSGCAPQTTAPGGGDAASTRRLGSGRDDWLERVEALEKSAAHGGHDSLGHLQRHRLPLAHRLLLGPCHRCLGVGAVFGPDAASPRRRRRAVPLRPLWRNGMRHDLEPSELRKKGEALAVARAAIEEGGGKDFDSCRSSRSARAGGAIPRWMPASWPPRPRGRLGLPGRANPGGDEQRAGHGLPYLYAVILARTTPLPHRAGPCSRGGLDIVFETAGSEGCATASCATRRHERRLDTEPDHIRGIVTVALERAREAWRENLGGKPA